MSDSRGPETRPYILIFGAAVLEDGRPSGVLRRRIEGGYSAWRRLAGAKLVLTGGVGKHGPAEACVMRDHLAALGVPEESLVVEPSSSDTLELARACAAILSGLPDVGTVWVCTSAFHAPRCRVLMRLLGFRAGMVHIPPAESMLTRVATLWWMAREALALPWDALLVLTHRMVTRKGVKRPTHAR